MAEFVIERDGVNLAGQDEGKGPRRPASRPDRHPPLRGHGLQHARALRTPGDRLRRPGPRPVSPAVNPRTTATNSSGSTSRQCSTTGALSAPCSPACRWARTRCCGSPSTGPSAWGPGGHNAGLRRGGGQRSARPRSLGRPLGGLRDGGIEGFVAAYGEPEVSERWRETVLKVIRQRLALHEHPEAVADALHAVPRSRPFGAISELSSISVAATVVASEDQIDPGIRARSARPTPRRFPARG